MNKKQTIGIDLGGTNVRIGLIEDDRIIKILTKKISSFAAEEVVINEITELVNDLINKNVMGIGIGVPSIVDIEKGIVYEVHNIPSWRKVHLKKIFEEKFRIPTSVNNDVNCFVLGEKHFGKGRKYRNIVGLAMGTGLGGGIIINNELYSGKNGGAGEFGLMQYLDKNYEYYCSGQFFQYLHGIKGEDLLIKAQKLDKKAISIFHEFGCHIGNLINSIMYALNPEIILLGGSVSSAYSLFKESLFQTLNKHEFKVQLDQVKIQRSTLKHAAVLGASKLPYLFS